MPLLRYFVFVGGILLALLFVSDAVLPKQSLPSFLNVVSSELPLVRIHSERKWPERIVFDTNIPTIKPAVMVQAQAEPTPKARVLEAFAEFVPPAPRIDAKIDAAKMDAKAKMEAKTDVKSDQTVARASEARPQPKRKVAKARPSHPLVLVAQQPHGVLFDSTW